MRADTAQKKRMPMNSWDWRYGASVIYASNVGYGLQFYEFAGTGRGSNAYTPIAGRGTAFDRRRCRYRRGELGATRNLSRDTCDDYGVGSVAV